MTPEELIENQKKANEEAFRGASMADLINPNSSANKAPEMERETPLAPIQQRVNEDGMPSLDTVRTFKGDVTDAIKNDNLTVTKIALAEQKNREKFAQNVSQESTPHGKNILLIVIIVIFFALGVGAIGLVFERNNSTPKTTTLKERVIVASEQKSIFDVSNSDRQEINAFVASEILQIPEDKLVREMLFQIKLSDDTFRKATISEFFEKLGARAPDELMRNLSADYFLGIHFVGRGDPFMIFFTSNYDIARSSLFEWEGFLKDDFVNYFEPNATSTTEFVFQDLVVSNHDSRALTDKNGKVIFFYSIVDSKTIIFADTAETLKEVLDRIRIAKLR